MKCFYFENTMLLAHLGRSGKNIGALMNDNYENNNDENDREGNGNPTTRP